MSSALWIGTTGLAASTRQMDVIGNNLANANTVGFKAGNTYFASMMSQTLSGGTGGSMQVGQGVGVASVITQFGQGSFESTANVTDLAIDGTGFFIVPDAAGLTYYTRAGSFNIDKTGNLVDLNGYLVQGDMFVNGAEVFNPENISLLDVQSQPQASTYVQVGANLDAEAVTGDYFSVSKTVYGADGTDYTLSIKLTRTANPREWGISASLADSQGTVINAAPVADVMTFDISGAKLTPAADVNLTFANPSIGVGGVIRWDLTSADVPSITGYASDSRVRNVLSDGYEAGLLNSLAIGRDGLVTGYFTNGQTQQLARVLLADFRDSSGLNKIGSYFMETDLSGPALINQPSSGGLGDIQSHSLEVSNTDVAKEFINMIAAQRAYQASSRIITTADQMLSELMNIRR
jgi:flagellar hook protein FlgE